MENPLTRLEKSQRIDRAFRLERDALRRAGRLETGNLLNHIVQNEDEEFKARLFDLITAHETPEEALAHGFEHPIDN